MNKLKAIAIVIGIIGAAFVLLEDLYPNYRKDNYSSELKNKAKEFRQIVKKVQNSDKFKADMTNKEVEYIVKKEISDDKRYRIMADDVIEYIENVIECEERYLCRIDNFNKYKEIIRGVWFLLGEYYIKIMVEHEDYSINTGNILESYTKQNEPHYYKNTQIISNKKLDETPTSNPLP